MRKKMRGLLLTSVLGTIVFGLTGCGGTTVNLNDYITVEVSGYNTMGEARVFFDKEAFEEDFGEKIEAKIDKQGGDAGLMSMELQFGYEPYDVMLRYCADYEVGKVSELSNGDVVQVVWDCEDENAKEFFNCTLNYSNIEYKVEGLEELAAFNPFEFATVEFSGIAPNGSVTITPDLNKKEMQYLSFYADKNGGLSNGDTVVVTANIQGDVNSFAQQFSSIPGSLTMEYQVKGLPAYVTSATEIDEATLIAMKQQAEDVYKAFWVQLEGNMDGLHELKYIGNYFLCKKEGMTWTDENQIYMVYKVDCSWDGVNYPHYIYVKYSNITVDEAGNGVVDTSKYELVEDKWSPTGSVWEFYYYGFGTLDELYNTHVASQIDKYTFENNIAE